VFVVIGTGLTFGEAPVVTPVLVVGMENVTLELGEAKAVRTDFEDNVGLVVAMSVGFEENVNVALLASFAVLNVGKVDVLVASIPL
jgi:hypothetical protein